MATPQEEDTFLHDCEHFERVYQRRKRRLLALQQRRDVSKDRLFLVGDQRPWRVFQHGYSSGKLQRRQLVFEHSRSFPKLHEACASGDREQARLLINCQGVCALERDSCGRIALHHAVVNEQIKVAKKLLRRRDAKLQVHVRDNSGRAALHFALGKMELLALHRRKGLRVPALVTAEMRAENRRYRRLWELSDRMLEMVGRKVLEGELAIDGRDIEGLKVLDMRCRGDAWDVCRSGDVERLEMIVKTYGCSTDLELSELKRTLLHEACENQQLQVVHFLLSTLGMPVLVQDTSGGTALHCAARRGFLDVCQLLLGKSPGDCSEPLNETAEQLALIQDVRGRTALHWCLLGPSDSLARLEVGVLLSQSCPATLHIRDHDGVSPLHLAIWRGNLELVQQFISLGTNVCWSSSSGPPLCREEYPEKAPWAPCGISFQHRRVRRLKQDEPTSASIDKAPDAFDNDESCKKGAPDWDNVQHPVETLWYWTQQRRSSMSEEKTAALTSEAIGDAEEILAEDELGCRKYGGICDHCKIIATNSAKDSRSTCSVNRFQLSPLLLAIRVCALNCSLLDHRIKIIELLLVNGVNPDEPHNDGCTERVCSSTLTALEESLRVFPRYPQILSVLLHHGAEQISVDFIERWRFSLSSTDAKKVENALCALLALDNIARSREFVVMLFVRKYFCTLRGLLELWSQMASNFSLVMDSAVADDGKIIYLSGGSPWQLIHEKLLSLRNRRRKPEVVYTIDTEHLEYLCGQFSLIERDNGDVATLLELLEYCVSQYFQQQKYLCTSAGYATNATAENLPAECERILHLCIRIIFKRWKTIEKGGQSMKSNVATWLQPTIFLGYFECALVLLETLNRLGGRCGLLDTVFEFYASAINHRGYQGRTIPCYHREFLVICTENLLTPKRGTSTTGPDQPQSDEVASVRSLVYMCSFNMALHLIKSCFNVVFRDGIMLPTMKTIQVGGKTMVQWIASHARVDIMEWLLATIPEGQERVSYWIDFVAASATRFSVCEEGVEDASSFVGKIFTAYQNRVQQHISISDRIDLLLNLMIKHVIPNDSVELTTRLLDASRTMNISNVSDTGCITRALKESPVLHSIARWGAVRIAEYCLSGRCSIDDTESDRINLQQIFVDQVQKRHELDECTPLELCRLLGHNHLYNLLTVGVLQASISPLKTNADTEEVVFDEPETAIDSDAEEESTTHWQVGVLRSVLDTNQKMLAENMKQGEAFNGYRRWTNLQDDWMCAVALNQVSHLQAMAITRPQCIGPDTFVYTLITTAVKYASLKSLKWIVEANAPVTKHLTDTESVECIYAAAKHPGDVYAKMTLLLLENQLSPGRLAGDGMGIPLLHRAACFSNAFLACRIMTMLLERSDCDVNALDAFGNTAVTYALAAGRLHNVCFLIQNLKCRLEAEYEGQACFYYVLHLVPSFASRVIVRMLLTAKRDRAFLHCDAVNKTCGCKSYEHPRDNEGDSRSLCGFCGHESSSHRTMPLPSWFRDQYDTYIAAQISARERSRSDDESSDSDGETPRHYLTDGDCGAAGDEDEETVLEDGRGRLDVGLLRRITVLRYDDLLQANGLAVAAQIDEETTDLE
ncbi:hypothetical protein ON010_g13061 [Phytophthora cinnamomi]|nr:hypothetical protein ON010_g13061 [Phytophthora cinnamomi]